MFTFNKTGTVFNALCLSYNKLEKIYFYYRWLVKFVLNSWKTIIARSWKSSFRSDQIDTIVTQSIPLPWLPEACKPNRRKQLCLYCRRVPSARLEELVSHGCSAGHLNWQPAPRSSFDASYNQPAAEKVQPSRFSRGPPSPFLPPSLLSRQKPCAYRLCASNHSQC